jgi:hypothetical protein
MANNSIIDDLSKVEEGDIIQIVNASTSKVIRVLSIDKLGKDEDWFINGSVNGGGGEASFSKLYFENMLFDGYEIKILKKDGTQVSSMNNNNGLVCFDIQLKQIGFIKNVNGQFDSSKKYWVIDFNDKKHSVYRDEFFVEGDIVEMKVLGSSQNVLISKLNIENKTISIYEYDKDNKNWKKDLKVLDINDFKLISFKVLDPNHDIGSVAYINQPQPKLDQLSLGVDFEINRIVEVKELQESLGEPKNEVWILEPTDVAADYSQERKNFFVVADIVKFFDKNDSNRYIKAKITQIDDENNIIRFYKPGFDSYDSFEMDFLDYWNVEILEYYNLKEEFKNKKPTSQNIAPQPQPQSIPQSQSIDFDSIIEDTKKEIGQLVFLRSLQSPLDFEENIKINQLISEKQKQLDKLIFQKTEMAISQDNVFDDLFEQSFTPIQNTYNNIFVKDEGSSDFFTPNGSRSLFNDAQNSLIRTPLFLDWFGDWQLAYQYKEAGIVDFPCSKVLSPNYEPQVVWHGTGAEFSYFRFDNFPAAYFAVNQSYSQWFADLHSRGGDGYTIPFFLNVRNPLDLTMFETKKIDPKTFFDYMYLQTGLTKSELDINPIFDDPKLDPIETWVYLRNNPKMLKKLADTKIFDGIHFYETNPGVDQSEPFYKTEAWIIFDPQQAKLADPTRGVLLFSSLKSFLLKKGGKI